MVLKPTHTLDVVEGIRTVAQEALVHTCMHLTGEHFIHHEMLHVVAGRCLMTLRAFLGRR